MNLDRIILSDNAVISDLSTDLENYHAGSGVIEIVAAEDKIYLGSFFPFNHRYFKLGTANTNSSTISLKVWDGDEFNPVVNIIDETILAGASMGQSGYITWTPDKEEGWSREDTSDKNGALIPVLGAGITIYDLYWVEVTFSADLSAGTALDWVGMKFSDDTHLEGEFPSLGRTNAKTSFESGKTDWEEQAVIAAQTIIGDLEAKRFIASKNQILERRDFRRASVQKIAEVIFNGYGDDFKDDRDHARLEYRSRLETDIYTLDKNNNARLDQKELAIRQGVLSR